MLLLVHDAVADLQGCEQRHALGAEAGLLAKLAASHRPPGRRRSLPSLPAEIP